ncbi:MAG: hypothetical protein JO022_05840 [Acidobacteriaceae bacterium]|nr:hypothetical protein [Acidobacteriaceae bacterium]
MFKARWLGVCLGSSMAFAQTLVDLRTQTKSVDFSAANSTKPFQTGTILPSICQVGAMFYKTDAAAGANLYGCTALNSWTLESGTSLPGVFQNAGKILSTDGTNYIWSSLGGDLSGALGTALVVQIQGRVVSSAQPSSGQVLSWNSSNNRWEPATPSGGSGTTNSTGASATAQLTDFAVASLNSSNLTVGANCSTSSPCTARVGANVYQFTSGASVSLGGGSGFAYFYISSSGSLTVGHNLSLTCNSGCVAQSGITAFPPDSIPLWIWSATNGSWNPIGTDERAFLSTKNLIPGLGIATTDQLGQTMVAIDPTVVSMQVGAPGTSSTACTQGSWATDQSFYYLCVANNSWKRVALSSW